MIADYLIKKNKLVLYVTDGIIVYANEKGKVHQGVMNIRMNPCDYGKFKLKKHMLQYTTDELDDILQEIICERHERYVRRRTYSI